MVPLLTFSVCLLALLILPGLGLVGLLRPTLLWDDIWTRIALGVVGTIVLSIPVSLATFIFDTSLTVAMVMLAILTVACWAGWWWRSRKHSSHADAVPMSRARRIPAAPAIVSIVLLVVAAAFGRLGGTSFASDSSFHAGLLEKLMHMPHLSWHTTGMFADSDLHPAYAVPGWHLLLAMAGRLAGYNGAEIMWNSPVLILPLLVLGWLVAGRWVLDHRWGGVAVAGSWLALNVVAAMPIMVLPRVAAYPGSIADSFLLPIWAGLLVMLVRHPATRRWPTMLVHAASLVCIIILHVNYVLYPALIGVSLLIGVVLAGRSRPESSLKAVLRIAGVQALTAAVAVAAMLPMLARLEQFGRGSAQGATESVFDQWGPVLVGGAGNYHLTTSYFAALGGMAVLLLLLGPLLWLVRRRDPVMWLVGPLTLLVLAISMQGHVFAALSGLGSMPVLARMSRVLPVALTMGWLVVHALPLTAQAMQRLSRKIRWLPLAAALALGIGLAVLAWYWPNELSGRDQPRPGVDVPSKWWIIASLTVSIIVALVLASRAIIERAQHRGRDENAVASEAPQSVRPVARRARRMAGIACVALLIVPPFAAVIHQAFSQYSAAQRLRVQNGRLVSTVAGFRGGYYDRLAEFRPGTVVLAPTRFSYQLMAISPTYTVAVSKLGLASTSKLTNQERLDAVEHFYDPTTSDADRLKFLQDQHVKVVISGRLDENFPKFIARHSDTFEVLKRARGSLAWCVGPCDDAR